MLLPAPQHPTTPPHTPTHIQVSLRDALDSGLLGRPGTYSVPPPLLLTIAHDVAAAMLHLHSEGIVHGDLKAANVMLSSADGCRGRHVGGPAPPPVLTQLTAKVADFGLALPLDPSVTHATLCARVRVCGGGDLCVHACVYKWMGRARRSAAGPTCSGHTVYCGSLLVLEV